MITVIIIAVAVLIVLGILLVNIEHHARKFKIAAVIIILMLIYFSVIAVLGSGEVNLNSPGGIVGGVYYYVGWVGHSLSQIWVIGKDSAIALGNAIRVNNTEEYDGRN
jgi:uncharacterized membrane protein